MVTERRGERGGVERAGGVVGVVHSPLELDAHVARWPGLEADLPDISLRAGPVRDDRASYWLVRYRFEI
ncbi:hypothetical protein GCM10023263_94210 [Phytohabitans rumicis]